MSRKSSAPQNGRRRRPFPDGGAPSNASRPVSRVLYGGFRRATAIPLGRSLPDASRNLPGWPARKRAWNRSSAPSLFGLAPGGVYRAGPVAGPAVGSYPTLSPLPAVSGRSREGRRFAFCGTFPGVAPAGRYPAPCFHGARTFLPGGLSAVAGAAVRPTDGTEMGTPSRQGQASEGNKGSAAISRSSVTTVERSATPSTRSGLKWRWKAVTTASVPASNCESSPLP